jgi:hypothetical protein
MSTSNDLDPGVNYELLEDGTLVIENYNLARPFASFFPGIAGLKGVPLWAFYVNRNQGIASFGIKNKNYPLMEFHPANNSYDQVASVGFRTFIKIKQRKEYQLYEPFAVQPVKDAPFRTSQRMLIRPYEVLFEETNTTIGLKTTVCYFALPREPIAALVRTVVFENLGAATLDLEIVDGMPKIIPYWMSTWVLGFMSYTAQAWTTVTNFKDNGIPFYRLKVEINDKPEVQELKKGNFYLGLVERGGKLHKAGIIIDPETVFGEDTSFSYPRAFMRELTFRVPENQMGDNKYPAAMSFYPVQVPSGSRRVLYSMAGHIESEEALNAFVARVATKDYFDVKGRESREIIDALTSTVQTGSNVPKFDLYCKQTYLDNLMRGGMPIRLPAGDGEKVFYVYSRKHGDLERDYNDFQLSPSYYSQGNGNYRDMNQNKRSDVFFDPWIGDFNVRAFYNLIQLDGYNPLLVKGQSFSFDPRGAREAKLLGRLVKKKDLKKVRGLLARHFEPGGLLLEIEEQKIGLKVSSEEFLRQVLGLAEQMESAEHGEGFWVDHWTYNLDLLESYLAVFPEKEREILLEKKEFTFYDNPNVVVPRTDKYVDSHGKIRQFDAVVIDALKAKMLRERPRQPHIVRTGKGAGRIYKTTLLAKMVSLVLNKLATLDSEGIGIEMEAEKPAWYDALNGLPGIFGSSVSETFELKRMLQFMKERLAGLGIKPGKRVLLAEEIHAFFTDFGILLSRRDKLSPFDFWDRATTLKENYRRETRMGVSGKEKPVTCAELQRFLEQAIDKINAGLAKAKDGKTGLYYTYFYYEAASCVRTKKVSHHGWPCVKINKFRRKPLPLFLEAEVHYVKTESDTDKILQLHRALKGSDLFDKHLNMYKVNASLVGQSTDIGRCAVFAPGWLENESIWLHMEYKYLLELLKAGLYKEFFDEFKNAGVCFQTPEVYGRSILENSSFIASSAFPDPRVWGRGYIARLSGSTAEFLSMWLIMTQGQRPFRLGVGGELELGFRPVIPGSFFTDKGTFSFNFLRGTAVCYHNPKRLDTYAPEMAILKIDVAWKAGGREALHGKIIRGKLAERIRNGEADSIDIYYCM